MKKKLNEQLERIAASLRQKLKDGYYEADEYEIYVRMVIETDSIYAYISACNFVDKTIVEFYNNRELPNVEQCIADWINRELHNDFMEIEKQLDQQAAEAEFERAWQMWDNLTH